MTIGRTKFWHWCAVFCFSALAVVMSDLGAIAQNQGIDNFELPEVDLQLDPDSDSGGMVPEGLDISLSPTGEDERGVVGADNRTIMTSAKYPWSAIGRLERRDSKGKVAGWCTATLIGEDTILTNAHCVVDQKNHRLRKARYVFRPNMIRGESVDWTPAKVVDYGRQWSRGDRDQDWAIMELDDPLGLFYGELGWYDANLKSSRVRKSFSKRLFLAGYSQDFPDSAPGYEPGETPGIHRKCSVTGVRKNGVLNHNCDTNGGASGSALIARMKSGKIVIVGLHAGTTRRDGKVTTNYGMPVSAWKKAAQENR